MKYENNNYVLTRNFSACTKIVEFCKSDDTLQQMKVNSNNDHNTSFASEENKIIKRKICTCVSGTSQCPYHPQRETAENSQVNYVNGSINGYKNCSNNLRNHNVTHSTTKLHDSREDQKKISKSGIVQCKSKSKDSLQSRNSSNKKNDLSNPNLVNTKVNGYCNDSDGWRRNSTSNCSRNSSTRYIKSSVEVESKFSFTSNSKTIILSDSCTNLNSYSVKSPYEEPDTVRHYSKPNYDDLKLSLTSLMTKDSVIEERESGVTFEAWLVEKDRQEREIREKKERLEKLLLEEKQKKLEMEQQNFVNWLNIKRQEENQKRKLKKKADVEEQRKKDEKLQKEELQKKQYQLWLKLKEEEELVKKLNEHKKKLEKEEENKLREERSKIAYNEWLNTSKDKPKPIPLNRGFESMKATTSISFINPDEWVPNIKISKENPKVVPHYRNGENIKSPKPAPPTFTKPITSAALPNKKTKVVPKATKFENWKPITVINSAAWVSNNLTSNTKKTKVLLK